MTQTEQGSERERRHAELSAAFRRHGSLVEAYFAARDRIKELEAKNGILLSLLPAAQFPKYQHRVRALIASEASPREDENTRAPKGAARMTPAHPVEPEPRICDDGYACLAPDCSCANKPRVAQAVESEERRATIRVASWCGTNDCGKCDACRAVAEIANLREALRLQREREAKYENALREVKAEVDEFYAGECDCYPEDGAICILHQLEPIFDAALSDSGPSKESE